MNPLGLNCKGTPKRVFVGALVSFALMGAMSEPAFAKKKKATPPPATTPVVNCEDLDRARTLYHEGKMDDAITELKFLQANCPKNPEIARMLSDMYWWSHSPVLSAQEARSGYNMIPDSVYDFDDTKLHLSDRLKPLRLRASFAELGTDNSKGQDYSLSGDYRVGEQHFTLGVFRTARIYTGDVLLSDTRIELGHLIPFGKSGYWENGFSYSPEAKISAHYAFTSTPHWVTSTDTDLYVSGRISQYINTPIWGENVLTVSPGLVQSFLYHYGIGVQAIGIYTYHWLPAGQCSFGWAPNNRTNFRFAYAAGHSVEGPGLEGNFRAYTGELRFRVTNDFTVVPNGQIYRGNILNQNTVGLAVEVNL